MESEVLRVKHGILNNLHQQQFISIVDIWHQLHDTKTIDKNWTLNQSKCLYQATVYKSSWE